MQQKVGNIIWGISMTLFLFGCNQSNTNKVIMANSDGSIRAELALDSNGRPFYQLFHDNKMVLDTSFLGLSLDGMDLTSNLYLKEEKPVQKINDGYRMLHGKQSNIDYTSNRYAVIFSGGEGFDLECQFDV